MAQPPNYVTGSAPGNEGPYGPGGNPGGSGANSGGYGAQPNPYSPPGPTRGSHNQASKNNYTPLIIGVGVVVLAAIIAGVIIFLSTGENESASSPIATATSEMAEESTNDFPSEIPLPDGVTITDIDRSLDDFLYVEFESATAHTETDFNEWVSMLEQAGFETNGTYFSDEQGYNIDAERSDYKLFIYYNHDEPSEMSVYER